MPQSNFTLLDWAILIIYFLGTMGIGFSFWAKSRSTEGFTAANRSLPGWVCGLSIFATYLSSISFLALPGKSYAANWNPFVFSLSLPIATWIAVKYFLPYYRKSKEVSAYAHLEHRFGTWARLYASICYLLTQLARIGAVTYLMALPLSILLGTDIRIIIVITGISVTIYALVGGIVAVIWADAMQAIVLMVGAVVCAVVMMMGLPEGPGQIFTVAAEHDKFSLGSFGPSVYEATFWVVLLYGVVMNLQNFGIDQNFTQRYISAKSDSEARKSVILGGLLYVPVSALFFFIGTGLFAYYATNPADLEDARKAVAVQKLASEGINGTTENYEQLVMEKQASLTHKDVGDKIFAHFIGAKLPMGLTGLLIAAIFAAGMSSISTSLNSSATLLMTDYYKRFFRKNSSDKEQMRFLSVATVVWGTVGTAIAFLLINVDSALDYWWEISGILGGGIVGLFLLGMISRAKNPAAITGVLLGLAIIVWVWACNKFPESLGPIGFPFHSFMVPVIGTPAILLIGLAANKVMKGSTTNDDA